MKPFRKPPHLKNADGEERRVGYEFEFTGVGLEKSANLVTELYNGAIEKLSTYEIEVRDSEFGSFKIELDTQLLRDKKYEELLNKLGISIENLEGKDTLEDSMMDLASTVVPFEIVTPPIPISNMHRLNELVGGLRQMKAKGTGSSILYAFGLHINPEVPDTSVDSILNHLRAFLLLDPWIRKDAEINISRRLTPFINEYEEDFLVHLFNPDYQPDLNSLIRDYFAFGNSRNRPLDLLPLFMYLDEKTTSTLIEEELTSARPTYHYRLPDCKLDEANWSLSDEWNYWVLVEKLADDREALKELSLNWLELNNKTMIGFEKKWIERMDKWVKDAR